MALQIDRHGVSPEKFVVQRRFGIDSEAIRSVNPEGQPSGHCLHFSPQMIFAMNNRSDGVLPDRLSVFHRQKGWLAYGEVVSGVWYGKFITVEAICQTYENAKSLKGFADCYALTPVTARSVLTVCGICFDEILAEEWRSGESFARLSERHGPKPETLARWLKAHGCNVEAGNHVRGIDTNELCRIIKKTGSVNRAAKALGIHWKTARRLYDKAGG